MVRTCALVTILALFAVVAVAQSPILGVLEDVPTMGSEMQWQEHRAVRVVFGKQGSEWRAYPSDCPDERCLLTITNSYPKEVVWTVAFDGRSLGQIKSTTPSRFNHYADVGLQNIISTSVVPTVGHKSPEFGGQTDAPVYRPLMANSESFVRDPDTWKRALLTGEQTIAVRHAFRLHFGKLCQLAADETHLKPLPYADDNIKIVSAYKSITGRAVARLHLKGAIDCSDTEAGFEIDDSWFAISAQMEVQHLDDGIWLVDAGDYDNDGHSELVFSINRDNRGGYELFYDDFRKSAVFEYSYH